jgi:hypothetical protein
MINLSEEKYKDISYNIVFKNETQNKPVIFFFHGFGGNRNLGPSGQDEVFARMGYCVVVMDAYEHGDRRSEAYETFDNSTRQAMIIDIEIKTAHDAVSLYNHLEETGKISRDYPLGIYGVSMGGAIVFYLASIFDKVKVLVSIVGSPSFVDFYQYKQEVYGFPKNREYHERLKKYHDYDPLINYQKLLNKHIFMSVGLQDRIVPLDYAKALSKKIDTVYQEYDLGHESNQEMLEQANKFVKQYL